MNLFCTPQKSTFFRTAEPQHVLQNKIKQKTQPKTILKCIVHFSNEFWRQSSYLALNLRHLLQWKVSVF